MKRYKSLFENYFGNISVNRLTAILYINPKKQELEGPFDEYPAVRGILSEDGNLLVWQGYITHNDLLHAISSNSDFKRLYKGNHWGYTDRNYITVIIEKDGLIYFGDGEELEEILEEDNIDIAVMVHNTLRKNKWAKFSKDFKV